MKCPVCNCALSTPAVGPYNACSNCGLYYQYPAPAKRYEASHEAPGDQMSAADKVVNEKLASWLVGRFPVLHFGVLDVGAKYPYLMSAVHKLRPDVMVKAIDGIAEIHGFGKELGVPVTQMDIETEPLVGKYSLITLVHCMEHFADPVAVMRKLADALVEGGSIYVRSPAHDVAGIERDYTPGHYEIHPGVFCASAVRKLSHEVGLTIVYRSPMIGAGQTDYILSKCSPITIGVGMIVKNEERDLPAALESAAAFADVIHIVDTGSTDGTSAVVEAFKARHYDIDVDYRTYTGASELEGADWKLWDFSKARNQYVTSLDPLVDFIFWLDADDVIGNPELIPAVAERGADAYDFQIVDSFDAPTTAFSHMRLWRAKRGVHYAGPCHEYPVLPPGTSHELSGMRVLHKWEAHATVEPSTSRNLRILARARANGDKSTRTLFYLANSYRDCRDWPNAIATYREYLEAGGWHDERIFAWLYLARSLRFDGKYPEAIRAALRGLSEDIRFSELWMELCYIAQITQSEDVPHYAHLAMREPPATNLFLEINKYTDQPWRMLASWYENRGELARAASAYQKVLAYVPNDADMKAALARVVTPVAPAKGTTVTKHVCRPGAAGDILMCLLAVQEYKRAHPAERIVFHSHNMYRDMVEACPAVDAWGALIEVPPGTINFNGYHRSPNYPHEPLREHLVTYFCEELGTYALPPFDLLDMRLPTTPVPGDYVTIQIHAGWSPYKNWPVARWQEIVNRLRPKIKVVQLGGADDTLLEGVIDFREKLSWVGSLGVIVSARLHLGGDSFGNHATMVRDATTKRTCERGVILFGSTQPLGSGYEGNLNLSARLVCSPCYREYASMSVDPLPPCPHCAENVAPPCMMGIEVDYVWYEIATCLSLSL